MVAIDILCFALFAWRSTCSLVLPACSRLGKRCFGAAPPMWRHPRATPAPRCDRCDSRGSAVRAVSSQRCVGMIVDAAHRHLLRNDYACDRADRVLRRPSTSKISPAARTAFRWIHVERSSAFTSQTMSRSISSSLAIVALCFWLVIRIMGSPFGTVLSAIRQNEARTIALGLSRDPFKLATFVIAGRSLGSPERSMRSPIASSASK